MLPQLVALILLSYLLLLILRDKGIVDFRMPSLPKVTLPFEKNEDVREKWFLPQKVVHKKKKPSAPIAGVCSECQKKVVMPYKCKFCGKVFCDDHRLPENHSCEGVKTLRRGR